MSSEPDVPLRKVRVDACCHCGKPFHLTSRIDTQEPGVEEIKVNCPYCEKPVLVKVPRDMLAKDPDGLMRGKSFAVRA